MDKLEVFMEADKLGIHLPHCIKGKQKRDSRDTTYMLPPLKEYLPFPVKLHITEDGKTKISARLYPEDEAALFLHMIRFYEQKDAIESLLIFDGDDRKSIQMLLPVVAKNANKLTIVTSAREEYEDILEELFLENGLLGESMSYKECTLCKPEDDSTSVVLYHAYAQKLPIHFFPQNAKIYDLTYDGKYEREITKKRPDLRYFGVLKYLDTTVKLMYNTLVKDTTVNPCVNLGDNKKQHIIRKDIKWTRKRTF